MQQTRIWENEYRTTLVCIDVYDGGMTEGRFYNHFSPEGVQFQSLVEFLREMEKMLDRMRFPQSFSSVRTFAEATPPEWDNPAETKHRKGSRGTFAVKVLFRQNASWQGSVTWLEGNVEEHFRSVLELIFLIDSAMSSGTTEKKGNPFTEQPASGKRAAFQVEVNQPRVTTASIEEKKPADNELTREEYFLLLKTARLMGRKRAYLLIKTIVNAGLKTQELHQLTVEALKRGMATVTSHGVQRNAPIPEPLCTELLCYAEQEDITSGPIFITKDRTPMVHSGVWKEVKQVCRRTGISEDKGSPTSLHRLYLNTYRDVCADAPEQTEQYYQQMLEKEEELLAWNI